MIEANTRLSGAGLAGLLESIMYLKVLVSGKITSEH